MANVSLGMTGTRVASVQNMLIGTGYLTDGADGVFGSGTQAAVQRFQAHADDECVINCQRTTYSCR